MQIQKQNKLQEKGFVIDLYFLTDEARYCLKTRLRSHLHHVKDASLYYFQFSAPTTEQNMGNHITDWNLAVFRPVIYS